MGLRIRTRIKLIPGVTLNLSKSGTSVSVGGKGITINKSKRGIRTTASIPGTGISYSQYVKNSTKKAAEPEAKNPPSNAEAIAGFVGLFLIIGIVVYLFAR